jgi:RHS repeat-associated protein
MTLAINFEGQSSPIRSEPISRSTGKERDNETGLDYFGARYYGSNMGRFLSPDEFTGGPVSAFEAAAAVKPGPLPYADITNPQSLNKYSYTYNNPLRYIDPDGHFAAPVHQWATEEAAKKLRYSQKTIRMMVAANLRVDRLKNQLNNKEHGMTDFFRVSGQNTAEAKIFTSIEARRNQAVKQALAGDYEGAVKSLGEGLHTIQDYQAHQGTTLLGHGGEQKNNNSPEKVRGAEFASESFLGNFESAVRSQAGDRAPQVLQSVHTAGDSED